MFRLYSGARLALGGILCRASRVAHSTLSLDDLASLFLTVYMLRPSNASQLPRRTLQTARSDHRYTDSRQVTPADSWHCILASSLLGIYSSVTAGRLRSHRTGFTAHGHVGIVTHKCAPLRAASYNNSFTTPRPRTRVTRHPSLSPRFTAPQLASGELAFRSNETLLPFSQDV
ncbi:hypothetical protein GCM10017687_03850 [Streptomyces echinatus]